MRKLITIIALTGMLLSSAAGWSQDFIEGFEDIPVMPGMAVDADTAIAFDTPAGRIVEAYAAGNVSAAAVIDAESPIGAPDNQASSCTFGVAISAIGTSSDAIAVATASGT